MRNLSLITLFLSTLAVLSGFNALAQNAPVTTCATVAVTDPDTVAVPITVTGFSNIGAISLQIDYDHSVINFLEGESHPSLYNFIISDADLGNGFHRLTMGWYGTGTSLPDSSAIMTMKFSYLSGITTLTFYDDGPSCEYADGNYNVLTDIPTEDYYINGFVCGGVGTPGPITGPDTLCQGAEEETYSIDPVVNATGYTWSVPDGATILSGQNTNTITVSYSDTAVSGNISVFAYNQCANGASSVLPIMVNVLPIADAGEDFTINYGTSTTLNAASGGTGNFSYHWEPEELLIDPNVQNPQTVILTSSTLFTVLVTNTNTLCQNSDEVVVTITGGPLSVNPVAVPNTICLGDFAQLFANAGGGSGTYSYLWTCNPPGNPAWSSTQANPVVNPDESKQYFVTVNDGFTSINGSVVLTVYQLPTATISGGDTLCGTGTMTTLTVDLTGTPPWFFIYTYGNTSVMIWNQMTTPYIINTIDPGTYEVEYVEDINCEGLTYGSASVYTFPIPETPVITFDGTELASSNCCGNQWYYQGAPIQGATHQYYTPAANGEYFDIVTLNGCSSDTSNIIDVVLIGLPELNPTEVNIFPNPASDILTIHFPNGIVSRSFIISITSVNGWIMKELVFDNIQENGQVNIDISDLPAGFYLFSCNNDQQISVKKLVIH